MKTNTEQIIERLKQQTIINSNQIGVNRNLIDACTLLVEMNTALRKRIEVLERKARPSW